MATLIVTATEDYSDGNPGLLSPTDLIVFSTAGGSITATFGSNQFVPSGPITNIVLINGDNDSNDFVRVNVAIGGAFTAAGWSLANWSASDRVILVGAGGNETLTGTAFNDTFQGFGGADNFSGGGGDDVFLFNAGEVAAGEIINGGTQTTNDIIQLLTGGAFDFSGATITGVEAVSIANTGVTVAFNGSQLRAGAIAQVAGVGVFAQGIVVNGSDVDLSGVTFSGWGGASQTISISGTSAAANTLIGSSQTDTISGTGNSADTMTGGGGADALTGGNGDDIFRIVGLTDVPAGETISGGGGTDTVRFAFDGVADLRGGTFTSIERLEFSAAVTAGADRARFNAGQFGAGNISTAVQVVGDSNFDVIEVVLSSAGTFSAAAWTFTNWSPNSHLLDIRGSGGNDTITGGFGRNQIDPGNGMDVVNPGIGLDSIFVDSNDVVAGESIDGGPNDDSIVANGVGTTDLSVATIINVEDLIIGLDGATVIVSGGQIGGSGFSTVFGGASSPNQALVVNGNAVDLSGVAFNNWDASKTITINGTGANPTLIGSSQNDIINGAAGTTNVITGGAGVDTLTGAGQADTFNYLASSEIVAGETINGGAGGTDTIALIGGFAGYDFSVATLTGIDRFFFPSNSASATLTGAQLGTGAITTVRGGNFSTLHVTGANVDLSAVTFENWGEGDTINIDGTAGVDDLTGSAQNDSFTVSPGADTIAGGGGDDGFRVTSLSQLVAGKTIDGEGGTDRLILDLISTADFTAVSISGVELLRYSQAASFIGPTAIFTGAQIGAGRISEIVSFFNDTLVVNGPSVDLSALTFTDWSSQDTIIINGTSLGGNLLIGSSQNDTINGSGGGDTINGGDGGDIIRGDAGADILDGGNDGDFLVGGAGNDQINGGAGFNIASWLSELSGLTLNLANQLLNAGSAAGDTVSNIQALYLTNSADTFAAGAAGLFVYGFGGNDTITGSSGSDFIDGGAGGDTIDAGAGFDYLSYNSASAAVTLDLGTPANNTGDAAGDTISNADAYILTEFGDTFIGLVSGQNIVFGFGGNDTLVGGFNANNWFFGGDGNDRMVGGGVADLYVGDNGADTIVPVTPTPIAGSSVFGFTPGTDALEISRAAFGLSAGYAVTAGSTFAAGTSPANTVASPTFLYYTNLGLLYFDPDGTGATAATLLMQMAGAPALATSDFHLV